MTDPSIISAAVLITVKEGAEQLRRAGSYSCSALFSNAATLPLCPEDSAPKNTDRVQMLRDLFSAPKECRANTSPEGRAILSHVLQVPLGFPFQMKILYFYPRK